MIKDSSLNGNGKTKGSFAFSRMVKIISYHSRNYIQELQWVHS